MNEGNRTSTSPLMLLLSVQLSINSCGPWSGAGGGGGSADWFHSLSRGDWSIPVTLPPACILEGTLEVKGYRVNALKLNHLDGINLGKFFTCFLRSFWVSSLQATACRKACLQKTIWLHHVNRA